MATAHGSGGRVETAALSGERSLVNEGVLLHKMVGSAPPLSLSRWIVSITIGLSEQPSPLHGSIYIKFIIIYIKYDREYNTGR